MLTKSIAMSLGLAAVTLVSLVGTIRADQIEERKAQRLLEHNAETIHKFAYLTVEHKSAEFDGTRRRSDGSFSHIVTFNGSYENSKGYFTLEFVFDKDGKLLSMKESGRSWLFAPFAESKLALAAFKGFIAGVAKDKSIKPETRAQMEGFVKKGDVNSFLIAMLNGKNGH